MAFKSDIYSFFKHIFRNFIYLLLLTCGIVWVILNFSIWPDSHDAIMNSLIDSRLGHVQVHVAGYLENKSSELLHLNFTESAKEKLDSLLTAHRAEIDTFAYRLKFWGLLSNLRRATYIQFIAMQPEQEEAVCPGISDSLSTQSASLSKLLKPGSILLPQNVTNLFGLKAGNEVVITLHNKKAAINALRLEVAGSYRPVAYENVQYAYLNYDDARSVQRLLTDEYNELVIRLKPVENLAKQAQNIKNEISRIADENGNCALEVHSWTELTDLTMKVLIVWILKYGSVFVGALLILIGIPGVLFKSVCKIMCETEKYDKSRIFWQIFIDGLIIGLPASLLAGLGSFWTLTNSEPLTWLNRLGEILHLAVKPVFNLSEVVLITSAALLLSLLAGLIIAGKASRSFRE